MNEAILGLIGGLAGAVLMFLGVRFTAKQSAKSAAISAEVSARQVGAQDWASFSKTLQDQIVILNGRVDSLETKRESDRARFEALEAELHAREARYGALMAYVRELLSWARAVMPEINPPKAPAMFADEIA